MRTAGRRRAATIRYMWEPPRGTSASLTPCVSTVRNVLTRAIYVMILVFKTSGQSSLNLWWSLAPTRGATTFQPSNEVKPGDRKGRHYISSFQMKCDSPVVGICKAAFFLEFVSPVYSFSRNRMQNKH